MRIAGIIAEYNPFHNGHLYQIGEVRRLTHADHIVVAMSGDFVQRGMPAIIDKYARTRMALSCGADLVLELPVLWSTASAEDFAAAGVALLEKTGCVDTLCFGAETDDLPLLTAVADILAEEPEDYRSRLSACLRDGMTFPAARSRALSEYLEHTRHCAPEGFDTDRISELLSTPNNILAVEYLKALKRRNSRMQPLLIPRIGAGYHDRDAGQPLASATAIRRGLMTGGTSVPETLCTKQVSGSQMPCAKQASGSQTPCTKQNPNTTPLSAMPPAAAEILTEYHRKYPYTSGNDFSALLAYLLLSYDTERLASCGDSNMELAARMKSLLSQFQSADQFALLLKSKNVTLTRISRVLCHILLGLMQEDYARGRALDHIPYLRMLGFRRDSAPLLNRIDSCSALPVIAKLADAASILPDTALALLSQDIFAADLYEQNLALRAQKTARSEYSRGLVIL